MSALPPLEAHLAHKVGGVAQLGGGRRLVGALHNVGRGGAGRTQPALDSKRGSGALQVAQELQRLRLLVCMDAGWCTTMGQ